MTHKNFEEKLQCILPFVEKPARYIGREVNSVIKNPADVLWHIALIYPDVYELGMSNTGLRMLYNQINQDSDCYAERSYAPWPDMREQMIQNDLPLYSLETHTPLKEFDCLGFSLQTELCYTNVPYILELAHIPVFAKDRGENDPLLLAGGPNMANPEPISAFFDFFVIGDGEAILPAILQLFKQAKQEQWSRQTKLKMLQAIDGVYVPSLEETFVNEYGEEIPLAALSKNKSKRTKRVWVDKIDNTHFLGHYVLPNIQPIHSRIGVEVMRGCTQGCRFCQAGYWDRPAREMEPSQIMAAVEHNVQKTGIDDVGLLSLSTADYSRLNDLVFMTKTKYLDTESRVNVSLPSLRADRFTAKLALEMNDVKGNSLTFAPETGSERLRQFINKNITNEQMFEAAEMAYKAGWQNIKLYFMIGIPSETWEDVKSIVWLAKEILTIGRRYGRKRSISANIGILSPKPFTALQWDSCAAEDELKEKVVYLREQFRGLGRFSVHDVENYRLESVLSRADRRVGEVIYKAYQKGAKFDCWTEHYQWSYWQEAFEECGIDYKIYQRKREFDEVLPWDVIDMGILKGVFKRERKRADELVTIPDCKWGECSHCGIPGNYEDIKLAQEPELNRDDYQKKVQANAVVAEESPLVFTYRIQYEKTGWSRFLSHKDCMTHFELAFRRSNLSLKYTEGFKKRIKTSAGPALPLGYASKEEWLDIHLTQRLPLDWKESVQGYFPAGLKIVDIFPLSEKDFSLGHFDAVNCYEIEIPSVLASKMDVSLAIKTWSEAETLPVMHAKKNQLFEGKEWIVNIVSETPDKFMVQLKYDHGQSCIRLNDVLTTLFGLSAQDVLKLKICKNQMKIAA